MNREGSPSARGDRLLRATRGPHLSRAEGAEPRHDVLQLEDLRHAGYGLVQLKGSSQGEAAGWRVHFNSDISAKPVGAGALCVLVPRLGLASGRFAGILSVEAHWVLGPPKNSTGASRTSRGGGVPAEALGTLRSSEFAQLIWLNTRRTAHA